MMSDRTISPFQVDRSRFVIYVCLALSLISAGLLSFGYFSFINSDKDLALLFGVIGTPLLIMAVAGFTEAILEIKVIRKHERDFKRGKHSVSERNALLTYYAKIYGQGQKNFKLTDIDLEDFGKIKVRMVFGRAGNVEQGQGLTNEYSIKKKMKVHTVIGKSKPYLIYDEETVIWVK